VLVACRARVGTAAAVVAGVRRKEIAAGVRSVTTEAEVRAAEAVRLQSARTTAGCRPRRRTKRAARLRLARGFGNVVEATEKGTQLRLATARVVNGSAAASFSDRKFL
jgi:hypothetical protein